MRSARYTTIGALVLIGVLTFIATSTRGGADPSASPDARHGDLTHPIMAALPAGVKIVKASDPNALKLAFVTNNASEFWKIAAAGVHK